jgi:hypothetical protein
MVRGDVVVYRPKVYRKMPAPARGTALAVPTRWSAG